MQLTKACSKKNLTKRFGSYLSPTSTYERNQGVLLKSLSMLILKKYLTLFLAHKLNEILHKKKIVSKIKVLSKSIFCQLYFDILNVSCNISFN